MFNMENSYCQTVHLRVILTQNMIKGILSMTNIKKLLGKKIKFYREKADLTQEQLAEKIRFSDPMSNEQLAVLEDKISLAVENLKSSDDKMKIIEDLNLLLDERNRKCKILK